MTDANKIKAGDTFMTRTVKADDPLLLGALASWGIQSQQSIMRNGEFFALAFGVDGALRLAHALALNSS